MLDRAGMEAEQVDRENHLVLERTQLSQGAGLLASALSGRCRPPPAATRVTRKGSVVFRSLILRGPLDLSKLMTNIHMVLLMFLR